MVLFHHRLPSEGLLVCLGDTVVSPLPGTACFNLYGMSLLSHPSNSNSRHTFQCAGIQAIKVEMYIGFFCYLIKLLAMPFSSLPNTCLIEEGKWNGLYGSWLPVQHRFCGPWRSYHILWRIIFQIKLTGIKSPDFRPFRQIL